MPDTVLSFVCFFLPICPQIFPLFVSWCYTPVLECDHGLQGKELRAQRSGDGAEKRLRAGFLQGALILARSDLQTYLGRPSLGQKVLWTSRLALPNTPPSRVLLCQGVMGSLVSPAFAHKTTSCLFRAAHLEVLCLAGRQVCGHIFHSSISPRVPSSRL